MRIINLLHGIELYAKWHEKSVTCEVKNHYSERMNFLWNF